MSEVFAGTRLHALEVAARTVMRRRRYLARARDEYALAAASVETGQAVTSLRLHGYFVIPSFFTPEICIRMRYEVDRVIRQQSDIVQTDDAKADLRIHGAERASAVVAQFHNDAFCHCAGEVYFGAALGNLSTLIGRLTANPGNLGSGQGWHRDAMHFQYKAMIYLSDVGADNGPFQLIEASHRPRHVLRDTVRGNLVVEPRDRIAPDQIERILGRDQKRLRTFTGEAGTLILFDSSTIHRGSPIVTGTRYALTNYYYPPAQMTEAMYAHFAPFAKAEDVN